MFSFLESLSVNVGFKDKPQLRFENGFRDKLDLYFFALFEHAVTACTCSCKDLNVNGTIFWERLLQTDHKAAKHKRRVVQINENKPVSLALTRDFAHN